MAHVTVCICTYRRPALLRRLLGELARQQVARDVSYSVVVADNDHEESARQTVTEFARSVSFQVVYCCEPQQNISLARNRAITQATGDYIAFLDDDEFPEATWLQNMLATCNANRAAGVLGPVRPYFGQPPPAWIAKGRFCERPEHPTGTVMDWSKSRTGNLLFRREILEGIGEPFDPQFGTGGEDVDFFRRMASRGYVFVWCNEAVAFEEVPPSRQTRSYMLKRALLRGRNNLKLRNVRVKALLTSCIAVPAYSLVLPGALLFGQHVFMKYCIKFCDHLGRVLALLGLNPVKERAT